MNRLPTTWPASILQTVLNVASRTLTNKYSAKLDLLKRLPYKLSTLALSLMVPCGILATEIGRDSVVFDLNQYDFTITTSGRTYPAGTSVTVEAGRGFLLWTNSGSNDPKGDGELFYGFVRPSVNLSTAGTYNAASMQIELYPVSFVGIRAGKELSNNKQDYSSFDCGEFNCQGDVEREFLEVDAALEYRSLFYLGRAGIWNVSQDDNQARDFIEIISGLPAEGSGDKIKIYSHVVGVRLPNDWAASVLVEKAEADKNQAKGTTTTFNITKKLKKWTLTAGVGQHDSSLNERDLTFVFKVEYSAQPKIYNLY